MLSFGIFFFKICHVFKTHNSSLHKKQNTCIKTSSFKPFCYVFKTRKTSWTFNSFQTKYINHFQPILLSKLLIIMNNIPSHLKQKHSQGQMCEFCLQWSLKHPQKKNLNAPLLLSIIQMLLPHNPPNSISHMCFH